VKLSTFLFVGGLRRAEQLEVIQRDRHYLVVVRRFGKDRPIVGLQVVENLFLLLFGIQLGLLGKKLSFVEGDRIVLAFPVALDPLFFLLKELTLGDPGRRAISELLNHRGASKTIILVRQRMNAVEL
jgi:hypothetical protein